MKIFTESHKPTHVLLSQQMKKEEAIPTLETSSWKSLQPQERKIFKKTREEETDEILIGEIKATLAPVKAPKSNQFAETFNIWLQFWGRSALYLCIISFIVGTSLSIAYFYKIEINLDKLLTVYIACSFVLWFLMTPVALHRSLKKSKAFIR
ncbi:MAG: hypothetical protein K2Q34_03530 [Alphaproteobacteria bacterium]|nr:hypothetical protein [Alphaproteobacteria bacterium]